MKGDLLKPPEKKPENPFLKVRKTKVEKVNFDILIIIINQYNHDHYYHTGHSCTCNKIKEETISSNEKFTNSTRHTVPRLPQPHEEEHDPSAVLCHPFQID